MNYFSAFEKNKVDKLTSRMIEYYRNNKNYYRDISFANSSWLDKNSETYRRILNEVKGKMVLELGCGTSSILEAVGEGYMCGYTGVDFSEELISKNRERYPYAEFFALDDLGVFQSHNRVWDVVFSVFVIEHSTRPQIFLDDCLKFCRPGGRIIILCPNFYSRGLISSQLRGFSNGSGREKVKNGRYFDALLTGVLSRLVCPLYIRFRLRNSGKNPVFLLNGTPACFTREYFPDADAVYVTCHKEIISYMCNRGCKLNGNEPNLNYFCESNGLLYLEFEKLH